MSLPTPKELKKLADTCRKVGITSFKCSLFEFTLSDISPKEVKSLKKSNRYETKLSQQQEEIITEGHLTEEQLMFFSTPNTGEIEV